MNDLNGLVPHLEITQSSRIHEEHLSLGFAAQIPGIIAHGDFDGLLRVAEAALTVGDERQIIQESIHTVGRAKLFQRQLVIALTVGDEGQRLTCEVDTGCLTGHPLGVLKGTFRIVLLQRVGGKDVQTDILRVLLGQTAQTFTIFGAQHAPFDALRHLGLIGATMRVRILRGEAHRAVGVTTRLRQVFTTLGLAVFHLFFAGELLGIFTCVPLITVLAEVSMLVVATKVTTAAITTVIAVEITTATVAATIITTVTITTEATIVATLTIATTEITTVITVEVTTLAITTIVTTEITTLTITLAEIVTLTVATIITTEATMLAITLIARAVVAATAAVSAGTFTAIAELARAAAEGTTLLTFAITIAMEVTVTTESAAITLAVTALMVIVTEASGPMPIGLAAIATRLEPLAATVTGPARAVGFVVAVGLAAICALFFCHSYP